MPGRGTLIVVATAATIPGTHAQHVSVTAFDTAQRLYTRRMRLQPLCSFCGRRLPRFVRFGPVRGGP